MSDSMAAHTASMLWLASITRKRFGSAAAKSKKAWRVRDWKSFHTVFRVFEAMVGQGWVHIQQIRAVGQQVVGGPHA